jgi:hypothetical protein
MKIFQEKSININQEEEQAMRNFYEGEHFHIEEMKKLAMINAIKIRCLNDKNPSLSLLERWFLTIKFYVCLLMNLEKKKQDSKSIICCVISYENWYGAIEQEYFKIGRGFFSEWWFQSSSDEEMNAYIY